MKLLGFIHALKANKSFFKDMMALWNLLGLCIFASPISAELSDKFSRKFYHAASTKRYVEVRELIREIKHSNSNIIAYGMFTAALNCDCEMLKVFLTEGISPNIQDDDGEFPLLGASRCLEASTLLVEAGANVNLSNNVGITPLIFATSSETPETVKYFLTKGADVNACDDDGDSALIEASRSGRLDMVRVLIQNGANLNHRNLKGINAFEYAFVHDHKEIVRYFISGGHTNNLSSICLNSALLEASLKEDWVRVKELIKLGAHPEGETYMGLSTQKNIELEHNPRLLELFKLMVSK